MSVVAIVCINAQTISTGQLGNSSATTTLNSNRLILNDNLLPAPTGSNLIVNGGRYVLDVQTYDLTNNLQATNCIDISGTSNFSMRAIYATALGPGTTFIGQSGTPNISLNIINMSFTGNSF